MRVVLAVRDQRLRQAIGTTLREAGYIVEDSDGLEALARADSEADAIGLLDWTLAGSWLQDDQRGELRDLAARLPLVLMVPPGGILFVPVPFVVTSCGNALSANV